MAAFKGGLMKPSPDRNPAVIGHIPGFSVGSTWDGRRDMCNDGVHAYLMRGIHGRGSEGAFSVVLSGGYPDDEDHGETVIYTGEGGRSPRKKDGSEPWNNETVADQTWKHGNKALMTSYQAQTPVRVIRGHTLGGKYAPLQGYRYDGLYMVKTAKLERGVAGFQVCRFRLERYPNQPAIPVRVAVALVPNARRASPEVFVQQKFKTIYPSPSPSVTPTAQRLNGPGGRQCHRQKLEDTDMVMSGPPPSYPGWGSESEPYLILEDKDHDYLKVESSDNSNVTRDIVPKVIGLGNKKIPYSLLDDESGEDEG